MSLYVKLSRESVAKTGYVVTTSTEYGFGGTALVYVGVVVVMINVYGTLKTEVSAIMVG